MQKNAENEFEGEKFELDELEDIPEKKEESSEKEIISSNKDLLKEEQPKEGDLKVVEQASPTKSALEEVNEEVEAEAAKISEQTKEIYFKNNTSLVESQDEPTPKKTEGKADKEDLSDAYNSQFGVAVGF